MRKISLLIFCVLLTVSPVWGQTKPPAKTKVDFQIIPLGDGNAILLDKDTGYTYRTHPCNLNALKVVAYDLKINVNTCWLPMEMTDLSK